MAVALSDKQVQTMWHNSLGRGKGQEAPAPLLPVLMERLNYREQWKM